MDQKKPRNVHNSASFGFVGEKSGKSTENLSSADTPQRKPGFSAWLEIVSAKIAQFSSDMDRSIAPRYLEPDDETLIPQKKVWQVYGISTAVIALLAVALYFFIGQFSFYTTGVKTSDFVECFNSITSDTDMLSLIPDYEDFKIPEDAKLGRKPVEFCDGMITMDADVRFGRIVSMTVKANELPNYDPETHSLNNDAENSDQYYFFAAMGKALSVYDYLQGQLSGFEMEDVSIFDMAQLGYNIHGYASDFNVTKLSLGALDIDYEISDLCLTVEPSVRTIADHINNPDTPTVRNFVPPVSEADAQSASAGDVQ